MSHRCSFVQTESPDKRLGMQLLGILQLATCSSSAQSRSERDTLMFPAQSEIGLGDVRQVVVEGVLSLLPACWGPG